MINNIEDIFELSPCQEGMLFHSEFDKKENLYIVQSVIKFKGELNVNKLKQCVDVIINKYQAFRTEFVWEGLEKPYQVVHNELLLPWYFNDLSQEIKENYNLNELMDFDKKQVSLDFPLFRFRLIKIAEYTFKLIFTRHHLLLDGWSHSIFLEELRRRYIDSFDLKKSEKGIKFSDYVSWLNKKDYSVAEVFWKSKLNKNSNIATPNFFPNNKNNNKEQISDESIVIQEKLTKKLLKLGRKHHFTMNSLFQSIWALLLNRYTSEQEIIYGSAFSGRPTDLPGSNYSYGAYINTIPIKLILNESMIFSDWILKNQRTISQFEKKQYSSLLKIREWAGIQNDRSLFNILFVYEKYPSSVEKQDWGNVGIEKVQTYEKNNYPITIIVREEKELSLTIKYNCENISSEYSKLILNHFFNILNNIEYYLDDKISNINILTYEEQRDVSKISSGDVVHLPNDVYIHNLFESQVKNTPSNIAVVDSEIELTYKRLNELSNQFANYLKRRGVKSNTLIGVFMERSVDLLICLLGIIKAGAAYIPLDSSIPPKRMNYIIKNSNLKWLVCDNFTNSSCENLPLNIINISKDLYVEEELDVIDICKLNPFDTAYIIYTSGTTGDPKGVEISQRGIMNYIKWGMENYMNNDGIGSIVHSSIGFDLTITSLYLPILTGKTTFMSKDSLGIEGLITNLKKHPNQSIIKITPSHFRLLSNIPKNEIDVKTFIIGGEQLTQNHISDWINRKANLINEYGPTETVVGSVVYKLEDTEHEEYIPIGKPIFNTQIYILDRKLRPVPKGIIGELYIGGLGVAKGYINNPELTKQKFLNNPFDKSEKFYKTGDMGRILQSGNIEFIGRDDNQVNINGYRIEIDEVERILIRHPNIVHSKVILESKNVKDQKGLVAFITSNNNIETSKIITWLQEYLPQYMIPLEIIPIDKFPVNRNGKIDLDELYTIKKDHLLNFESESKTEMEKFIEDLWCNVIGVDLIESYDNFFLIGGHSLYAMRVISEINGLFDFDLSISSIFNSPTLKMFSSIVEEKLLNSEGYKGENDNEERNFN